MTKIKISKKDICKIINESDLVFKAISLKNRIFVYQGCLGIEVEFNKAWIMSPKSPEIEAVVFEKLIKQYRHKIKFKIPDAEYFRKHNKKEVSKNILKISDGLFDDFWFDDFWIGYDVRTDDYLLTLEDYSVRVALDIKYYIVQPITFKGKEDGELRSFIKSTYYRGIIDLNFELGD